MTFAGAAILVATDPDNIRVAAWDTTTGELITEFEAQDLAVNGLTTGVLPDGRTIAVAAGANGIGRWDIHTGQALPPLSDDAYWSVATDGNVLAAAKHDGDGVVDRWDLGTGEPLEPRKSHAGIVSSVIMAAGPMLISGDETGLILREEADAPLFAGGNPALAVTSYARGHLLIAGDRSTGTIHRWDLRTGEPIGRPIRTAAWTIDLAAATPGGRPTIFTTASDEMLLRRWDALTGDPIGTPEPAAYVAAAGELIATAHLHGECRITRATG